MLQLPPLPVLLKQRIQRLAISQRASLQFVWKWKKVFGEAKDATSLGSHQSAGQPAVSMEVEKVETDNGAALAIVTAAAMEHDQENAKTDAPADSAAADTEATASVEPELMEQAEVRSTHSPAEASQTGRTGRDPALDWLNQMLGRAQFRIAADAESFLCEKHGFFNPVLDAQTAGDVYPLEAELAMIETSLALQLDGEAAETPSHSPSPSASGPGAAESGDANDSHPGASGPGAAESGDANDSHPGASGPGAAESGDAPNDSHPGASCPGPAESGGGPSDSFPSASCPVEGLNTFDAQGVESFLGVLEFNSTSQTVELI